MKESPEHEYDLLEYARICVRRRKCVYWTFAGALVVALLVAIFTSPVYKSETRILPTEDEFEGGGFNLMSAASRFGLTMPSSSGRLSGLYPQILTSHTIIERVLAREFESKRMGRTATLYDILDIEGDSPEEREVWGHQAVLDDALAVDQSIDTGITSVKVFTPEARLSEAVALAFVDELEQFLRRIRHEEDVRNREFIQARLDETSLEVVKAENELMAFRERNMKIENSPKLRLEIERLLRAVRLEEQMLIELQGQLEIAKIEAVKNTPLVQILDPPLTPILRERPKRALIMVMGAALGVVFGVAVAFLVEFFSRMISGSPARVRDLSDALQQDLAHVPVIGKALQRSSDSKALQRSSDSKVPVP